jgi:1-acyl-sn-glycerol-3-phosphate acyltransferase
MDWSEERAGLAGMTSTALVSLRGGGGRAPARGVRGLLDRALGLAADARRAAEDFATLTLGSDFEQRAQHIRDHYARMGDDPFGLDPEFTRLGAMATAFMHRRYFRTEVHGIEHIPPGRALLIANHSGQIPIDGLILALTLFFDANPPRLIRAMVEKWMQTLPFIAPLIARLGQVVGVPANCHHLLEREELILAFPEGVRGIVKPYTRRYQLEDFGQGFMRLALATRSPIVPVAVIGAEEQYISVGNLEWAARAIGLPALPVVPQLLLPGGLLPLPTKYRIHFGEPLKFEGDPADERVVSEHVWLVRQTIQRLLVHGLERRRSVFF